LEKDDENQDYLSESVENGSVLQREKANRKENGLQIIIPTPCLPEMQKIPQNAWNALVFGQNLSWNWPIFCQFY